MDFHYILSGFGVGMLVGLTGVGGGSLMIVALVMVMPPAVAVPVHGIVQLGSNAGRAVMMRRHVQPRFALFFILEKLVIWRHCHEDQCTGLASPCLWQPARRNTVTVPHRSPMPSYALSTSASAGRSRTTCNAYGRRLNGPGRP